MTDPFNHATTFGSNLLTYDLNGNLATVTESGVTTTYRYYYRARAYDSSTGTFIQKDPIGIVHEVNPSLRV